MSPSPSGTGMQTGRVSQQGQMQQMAPQPGFGAQSQQQMGGGPSHLQSVTLQDILQEDVVTAEPDTPLPTIAAEMKTEDVGAVVIVEDDEPLGIVTDRKIALALGEMENLDEKTARDIMSDDMVAGPDNMSVYDAIKQLSDENIRRLPVIDEDGELVGIVTLDDIIVLLGKELQETAEIIKAQSPRL